MSKKLVNSTFPSTNQAYSILALAKAKNSISEVLKLDWTFRANSRSTTTFICCNSNVLFTVLFEGVGPL